MSAAVARPSSTLILARHGSASPEFLMVRRDTRSAFGGAWVFPGGVVEAGDESVAADVLAPGDANRILGVEEGGLAYFSAAVRELFEETGIFLGEPAIEGPEDRQRELLDGKTDWRTLVDGRRLAVDRLHYVSFWITPEVLPVRFSTRFFLTRCPDGAQPTPCGIEVHDCRWFSARDALVAGERGDIKLHFPTRLTLESLSEHESVDALLEWGAARAAAGVPCIFPALPEEGAVLSAYTSALRISR